MESAEWPSAEPPRRDVTVLFELTVTTQGRVVDPIVLESAGAAFDAAATEAILSSRFEAARRDSEAITVRVRFRYVFVPPLENAVSAAAPTDYASAPSTSEGLPSRHLEPPRETKANPQTAPESAQPAERDPADAAKPTATNAFDAPLDGGYGAVARVVSVPREVTKHTVEQVDLNRIPGTNGDALRAIEVLPGVARTSISSGDPILRGAAWHETRSYIAGSSVPLLYHFGGVKSAFNSRLLSSVDVYPSNFGVGFGRSVGGVVVAKLRDPATDRFRAMADVNVIDAMLLAEAPVTRKLSFAVAGRRSNIGHFYRAFAPKSGFGVVSAPSYYDYQAIARLKLNPKHDLRLIAFGSRDSLELVFTNPSDFDPALRDSVDASIAYHRLQLAVDSQWSHRLTQRTQVTLGATSMRQFVGNVRAEMLEHDLFSRFEWTYRTSETLRTHAGLDIEALSIQGYYIGPRPPQAEGEVMNGGMSTEKVIDMSNLERINAIRPGAYVELEWHPTSKLSLSSGLRIDHYSDQQATTANPRMTARYEPTPRLTIKWGIGRYSQNPQYYEMIRNFGNPNLRPYHAMHYGGGIEHRATDELTWGIDGYYKRLYNRVVATPGGEPPSFVNDGVGRIYGAELFGRYQSGRCRAWIAYSLSRSERQDRDEPWRLFEKDQTHVFAATANYALGRGWELGGRFRVTTGNPYTPVRGSVYDATVDTYRPINAAPFSARNPTFHQLDLRLEKTWEFSSFRLASYLDVQNVYNAKNYEGLDYSYDFTKRQGIAGLPLLPNLGLRGEI